MNIMFWKSFKREGWKVSRVERAREVGRSEKFILKFPP